MSDQHRTRITISPKKLLIDLNLTLEEVKNWTEASKSIDSYTTDFLKYDYLERPQIATDILLLEDRRFFRHHGAEIRAVPRGIKRWLRYGRFGGVSTVEQQLVRTVLQRRERTLARKSHEVVLAWALNLHVSKRDILASYLNTLYFGPRLYGIDVASEVIFGKPASDLVTSESALIASLPPYPLPPLLSLALRESDKHFTSVQSLIGVAMKTNPAWVEKINRRMVYLDLLRAKYSEIVWRGSQR